jgi:hypothetical protein
MDLQPSDHSQEPTPERLQLLPLPILIKRDLKYAIFFLLFLISSIVVFFLVSPFGSQPILRIGLLSQIISNEEYLGACDYSRGRWVWDGSYPPQSYAENCPFLDPGFRCSQNGRRDEDYRKWRWQPEGCDLPRYVCMVMV